MKREPTFVTDYGYILRKDAPSYVFLADAPVERTCKDCGVKFIANRLALRCPGCRPAALRAAALRSIRKSRDKRKRLAARGAA